MIAAFSWASLRISGGIWLLIEDCTPGFEGFDDLVPTKRFRGLAALVVALEPLSLLGVVILYFIVPLTVRSVELGVVGLGCLMQSRRVAKSNRLGRSEIECARGSRHQHSGVLWHHCFPLIPQTLAFGITSRPPSYAAYTSIGSNAIFSAKAR